MKIVKIPLLVFLISILALATIPLLASTRTLDLASEQIDVLQVMQFDSTIKIVLDYNLSSTSKLDTNDLLTILVIFSESTQEEPFIVNAAMLFFHTADDQFFLFWTLEDPYQQAQNWQLGTENEHYQINDDLLTLNFIEFLGVNSQEIKVLAKISSDFEVNSHMNDFRVILDQFIANLPLSYEYLHTEPLKTKKKRTPGFTFVSIIGIFLSIIVIKKSRTKNES
ncbi:MAG: hypothetical protein ACFE8U_05890 [Candidatus Hermodarchaeota archaeon]